MTVTSEADDPADPKLLGHLPTPVAAACGAAVAAAVLSSLDVVATLLADLWLLDDARAQAIGRAHKLTPENVRAATRHTPQAFAFLVEAGLIGAHPDGSYWLAPIDDYRDRTVEEP